MLWPISKYFSRLMTYCVSLLSLQTGQQQSPTTNEMSPTKSVTASPIRCASRGSTNSDPQTTNQSLNGPLYSPEDTLNNDFFYDDEFSIPFDANLGDNEPGVVDVEMLDSMDINTLLTLSRVYDDNQEPMINRLVTSKSDTCLYHQMSTSGEIPADVETSGDQSMSDQCTSSAELSELRSDPLFSPPPINGQQGALHQYSTDSLGRDEPLSGSFTMGDEARYTYDWTANKGQYILSFDNRGHRLHSDDDSSSYHDSIPSSQMTLSLTSWAQKSRDSNPFMMGSRDSLGKGYLSSGGSTPAKGSPRHCPRQKANEPGLTSWSKLKDTKPAKNKSKLTTWRSMRETKNPENEEGEEEETRCHSLPDMSTRSKSSTSASESEEGLSPREGAEEKLVEIEIEEEGTIRKSTTSLLEVFQRLRSQEEMGEGETMVSSSTLQMLTGTWSMSPVSSEQSPPLSSLSERSPSLPALTSWSTVKDLRTRKSSLGTSTTDSIDSTSPDRMDRSTSSSQHSDSCQNKLYASFACNTSLHETPRSDAQCGSLILTQSLVFGKDIKDFCGQFPPNAKDCSVQTSFEYGVPTKNLMNRSLQTSLGSSTESNKGDLGAPRNQSPQQQTSKTQESPKLQTFKDLATKRQDTIPKTPSPITETFTGVEPLKKTEPSLTSSLLFSTSALPDLSFLNKGMTQSISSLLEQANKSPPLFNPRMAHTQVVAGHVDMSIGQEALSKERRNTKKQVPATTDSRDCSPGQRNSRRHDSLSSTSVCSTSSSGVDSGCYESSQSQGSRNNTQYLADLGLGSTANSSGSSTLSESSGNSVSPARADDVSTPVAGDLKKEKQEPEVSSTKSVTSFAELASRQQTKSSGIPINPINKTETTQGVGKQMVLEIPPFSGRKNTQTDQLNPAKGKEESKEREALPVKENTLHPQEEDKTKQENIHRKEANGEKLVPPPKPPRLVCQECHQAQQNEMISSVPVYSEPIYKMVARPVKQVEYLQISPVHKPYHLISMQLGPSNQHRRSRSPSDHSQDCMCTSSGCTQKKPLKSCLVKRRRARKNLFKHRSYSDSHDLAVMKYSVEGQTRYQLIAPSSCDSDDVECVHGLSMGAGFTSLPTEVLQENLKEQVKKRLSQQDLPVLKLDKEASGEMGSGGKPATVANSPDLIPVMPCPCTHGGSASITSHSSDDSCSDCAEANRHKKSVSFSEEVFYHSPYTTPHGSPKKHRAPPLGSHGRSASHPVPRFKSQTTSQSKFLRNSTNCSISRFDLHLT